MSLSDLLDKLNVHVHLSHFWFNCGTGNILKYFSEGKKTQEVALMYYHLL